ncbi:hypothetical protein PL81_10925 [Streptomyces sp. RSD-27]|nr:hypothetical protein PL81_10925 [Streptomyces sp. RSD-27]
MTSENIATLSEVGTASAGVDDRFLNELVARAPAAGLQLTDEGGLLQQLTKRLRESALEGEMSDHLGYDRHASGGQERRKLEERQTVQPVRQRLTDDG